MSGKRGTGDIFRLESSGEEYRRGETDGNKRLNWLRVGSREQEAVALKVSLGTGCVVRL